LIDLQVGDIEDGLLGKYVVVAGKTGTRRLLLLESTTYVQEWLDSHPNPVGEAFLWCKLDSRHGSTVEQVSYQNIRLRILQRARERAGIDKPVWPYCTSYC